MTNTICLDEKYRTTRLLCKIVNDECLMLNEDGRIKEECKWNINNSEFNIQNSKLIGSPEEKFETVLFLPIGENRKGEGGLRTKGYFKKSFEDKPLISIITVVYNGEKYLEETIQSVINQTYDNVEYIIIDGGSTDRTLDIIKKYEDKIDYWVSEKDYGLYHAMNKGISLCIGEIIGMINADDYYYPNTFEVIVDSFKNIDLRKNFFFGDMMYGDTLVQGWREKDVLISAFGVHPSMFVPKVIYNKIGGYKLNYKILSDYDFMYRAYHIEKIKPIYTNEIISFFRPGGLSGQNIFRAYTEELLIKIENGQRIYIAFGIYLLKLLKYNLTKLIKGK